MYLAFESSTILADQKVLFAASYLADKAYVWFQSRTIERRTNNRPPYGPWEDFQVEHLHTFAPINDVERARDQLAQLRQHGTVESYITKFRSVTMLIPDLSLAEALDRFKRVLNQEVLIAVELQGFSILEACQRLAKRVDTITSLHRGSTDHRHIHSRGSPHPMRSSAHGTWCCCIATAPPVHS